MNNTHNSAEQSNAQKILTEGKNYFGNPDKIHNHEQIRLALSYIVTTVSQSGGNEDAQREAIVAWMKEVGEEVMERVRREDGERRREEAINNYFNKKHEVAEAATANNATQETSQTQPRKLNGLEGVRISSVNGLNGGSVVDGNTQTKGQGQGRQ